MDIFMLLDEMSKGPDREQKARAALDEMGRTALQSLLDIAKCPPKEKADLNSVIRPAWTGLMVLTIVVALVMRLGLLAIFAFVGIKLGLMLINHLTKDVVPAVTTEDARYQTAVALIEYWPHKRDVGILVDAIQPDLRKSLSEIRGAGRLLATMDIADAPLLSDVQRGKLYETLKEENLQVYYLLLFAANSAVDYDYAITGIMRGLTSIGDDGVRPYIEKLAKLEPGDDLQKRHIQEAAVECLNS